MTTTPVLQNALDQALEGLEKLGLTRPPNILLAEYLAALTSVELLSPQVAANVSDAFNRLRYSVAPEKDPELREVVEAIDAVAERFRVMSAEERNRVCQSVQSRLSIAGAARVPTSRDTSFTATGASPSPGGPAATEASPESSADSLFEPTGSPRQVVAGASGRGSPRARFRLPLEACAIVGLAVFFGGYFSRDLVEQAMKAASSDQATSGRVRDVWVTPEAWVETVRKRGTDEMRIHHVRTARLALELALACSDESKQPLDQTLNSLAWSYLFPDEDGVTNPERALQLANRAIEIERNPMYLDTAALAYFQLGKIPEALRLQREALVRIDNQSGTPLWRDLSNRLNKFEDAERQQQAASATRTN